MPLRQLREHDSSALEGAVPGARFILGPTGSLRCGVVRRDGNIEPRTRAALDNVRFLNWVARAAFLEFDRDHEQRKFCAARQIREGWRPGRSVSRNQSRRRLQAKQCRHAPCARIRDAPISRGR